MSRSVALLWFAGAVAGGVFLLEWAGFQGKDALLTDRHLADIWWHFPVFWLLFWMAFMLLATLSDRISQ